MLAERLGNFDFCALQNADKLQGVDHGFALKVIVGDDKGVVCVFGDFTHAGDPGSEFLRRIEIVVALVNRDRGVVGKPGVVAAAVKADVADGRRRLGRGWKRAADEWLINVADAGVVLTEEGQGLRRIPGRMANFDDEWIIGEAF